MVKHARNGGSKNKFKNTEQPIKGESDSEGEDDHVAHEEPADRRGGKIARIEAVAASAGPDQGRKDQGGESGFKNKQRVLLIASRGIIHRFRHLMLDIGKLLPHSTKDAKMESKDRPMVINEICESRCYGCFRRPSPCNMNMYFVSLVGIKTHPAGANTIF